MAGGVRAIYNGGNALKKNVEPITENLRQYRVRKRFIELNEQYAQLNHVFRNNLGVVCGAVIKDSRKMQQYRDGLASAGEDDMLMDDV